MYRNPRHFFHSDSAQFLKSYDPHRMLVTLLILTDRMLVRYEPSKLWPSLPRVSPLPDQYMGGLGFESYWGLLTNIFFVPHSQHAGHFIFHKLG